MKTYFLAVVEKNYNKIQTKNLVLLIIKKKLNDIVDFNFMKIL